MRKERRKNLRLEGRNRKEKENRKKEEPIVARKKHGKGKKSRRGGVGRRVKATYIIIIIIIIPYFCFIPARSYCTLTRFPTVSTENLFHPRFRLMCTVPPHLYSPGFSLHIFQMFTF